MTRLAMNMVADARLTIAATKYGARGEYRSERIPPNIAASMKPVAQVVSKMPIAKPRTD